MKHKHRHNKDIEKKIKKVKKLGVKIMASIQDAVNATNELGTKVNELIALIPSQTTDTQPIIDAITPIVTAVNAAIASLQTPA